MTQKDVATNEKELQGRLEKAIQKRTRTQRPFPASTFEESLEFAKSVYEYGSGKPVRRLSLFDHIKKAPESGPSRQLITNSSKYGLLKGSAGSEHLELTEKGILAIEEDVSPREKAKARISLAISDITPFHKLYEKFSGNKLPAKAALIDAIKDFDVNESFAEEGVDTFVINLRYLGLLQTLSGAERIVTTDHLLDSLPTTQLSSTFSAPSHQASEKLPITADHAQFETACFYITPIGEEGSEQRKHADLFLGSIVEPAIEHLGLKLIRADIIDKPGTITRQIIEYIIKSRLVIADLSFHNPNVFYELALRHAVRKPVVQIIRASDRIPFDLNQIRTIRIDTSDIYTLVPRIETYRSEISNQVRRAMEDPDSVDNPITTFYPDFNK
ncbi:hypothetical protein [Stutzerimonas chloritidismutans]|nr:hypothetical protein FEV13_09010 [Stutzerimonas degradans]